MIAHQHLLTFSRSSSVSPDNPDHFAILRSVPDAEHADLLAAVKGHAAVLEPEPVDDQVAAAWQEEDAGAEVGIRNVVVAVAVAEVRIACAGQ